MYAYKIHHSLWRLSNNGKVKDVKVSFGKIVIPENPYNILTETEIMFVENEISKK